MISGQSHGIPPRRGSFQDGFASHAGTRDSTSASELSNSDFITVPQQRKLNYARSPSTDLDEEAMLTDDDPGFARSSSVSRQPSTTAMIAAQSNTFFHDSPKSEGDMIEVSSSPYQMPLEKDGRGKLKNKYVLADGSVVNGKGLGRGRPGFKRGPRKSALSREIVDDSSSNSAAVSTPSPGPQPRSSSIKRKRTVSDISKADDNEYNDEEDASSRESTPEYNPAASTQTRSGRQSQKPAQTISTDARTASPAAKRPALAKSISSPSVKRHPKIKAKVYRGREQFALCEHCLRSNGPPGNLIVFCDACNKCWHQRCHEPRIEKEVVADTKAEWFCADCDRILHGKKKNKPGPKPRLQAQAQNQTRVPSQPQTVQRSSPSPHPIQPRSEFSTLRYGMPWIPGMSLSPDQRKAYLNSLPKEKLIELVLRASDLAPNMPIFETPYQLVPMAPPPPVHHSPVPMGPPPPTNPTPQASTPRPAPVASRSNVPIYSHPTAGVTSKPNTQAPPLLGNEEDEGYYDDYDEMALLYPKPGEGIYDMVLPPESSDIGILLEGPDCKTFSHWVRGQGDIPKSVGSARW
ncbi:hypothetical protein LTS08_000915 [Lithohypha guttulata]|nr:hypothetical protein LTS08_000915 [Lithohypha guttulata]